MSVISVTSGTNIDIYVYIVPFMLCAPVRTSNMNVFNFFLGLEVGGHTQMVIQVIWFTD